MINLLKNFITEEQEKEILDIIPPFHNVNSNKRNRVLRYGSKKSYRDRHVSEKIPEVFEQYRKFFDFDSVTINEYFPGQSIDWHTDNLNSGDEIIVLSLLGKGIVKFRHLDEELKYEVPPRSLLIFDQEHRWNYEHRAEALEKRYSIVFRNSED